jgi:two-component system NtrC family sensor kinase
MTSAGRTLRLSVQTKVLIPVLGFLFLLPVIMGWVVDTRITHQAQGEARQALATADNVFVQALGNRRQALLDRAFNAVNEPLYQAIALVAKSPSPRSNATIQKFLAERLRDYGDDCEVILFTYRQAAAPVFAWRRTPILGPDEFERATAALAGEAIRTGPAQMSIGLRGLAFDVVAVPWTAADSDPPVVGAQTIGVRIQDAAVRELGRITNTEIILTRQGEVLASTLAGGDAGAQAQIAAAAQVGSTGKGQFIQSDPVRINGRSYLALSNTYDQTAPDRGFQYVLLFDYDAAMSTLADTRQALIGISAAGILLSILVVWFFVRRIIQPLRELRDSAEAIGRGDFSRRLSRISNDECGDLAHAFNRMTTNLETSRQELQHAVDTLKNTQAQLVQSEKLSAVGQFVAGVAHELNNPLTAVIGFSELLSQTGTDEKVRPHLELIAKSAHRCHKIVQNLLGFARQHAPERKLVPVNSTIDEVLELMAYDLRTSNIEVRRDFQPDLPAILADPNQLQQVFVNIVGNARQAIQAFRPDGLIRVRTREHLGKIQIEFSDNGPGIRAENISRIFDPFFTTKAVGKGTGLGLSLSYGIIQEHGGHIRVESRVGEGASFVIELPAEAATTGRRGEAERPGTIGRRAEAASGKAVLVIDDEVWILDLAAELLRHAGHVAETATGGEEGLAALRRRPFDVIVCDWKMPGLNGMQFYQHLLASDPAAAARVMFMSGDVINDKFQEFLRRHDRLCLSKPFPIEEFQEAVARQLAPAGTPV